MHGRQEDWKQRKKGIAVLSVGEPRLVLLTGDRRIQSPKLALLLSVLELLFMVSRRPVPMALIVLCILTIGL